MSISILVMQIVLGFSLGAIFALMASGLSIIYGLLDIVNFAHGAFYMLGAYAIFVLLTLTGNFWVALVLAVFLVAALGMATEIFLLRPLYPRNDPLQSLILTFGLSVAIPDAIKIIFGLIGKVVPYPPKLAGYLQVGSVIIPNYQLFVFAMAIIAILSFWVFLKKTDVGVIMQASTQDSLMVRLLGIDVSRIWTLGCTIGIAFAALAGAVAAPLVSATPDMGVSMIMQSFVVVIVGGLGSLGGALVAGLIIGQVVSFTSFFAGAYSEVVIFIVMAIVLLIRPRGLFGIAGRE